MLPVGVCEGAVESARSQGGAGVGVVWFVWLSPARESGLDVRKSGANFSEASVQVAEQGCS